MESCLFLPIIFHPSFSEQRRNLEPQHVEILAQIAPRAANDPKKAKSSKSAEEVDDQIENAEDLQEIDIMASPHDTQVSDGNKIPL